MCLRSTEPPLLPNPCYRLAFFFCRGLQPFLCSPFVSFVECFFGWLVCRVFYFFLKRWKFFKNNFSFGLALQALLKTLVVCWLVRFLIVLANCVGYVFSCPLNANSNSSFNIGCVFELMNSSFKKQ